MGLLRKTVLFGRVWTAVIAAFVAAAPDIHCVCPDGRVKQYPLLLSPVVGGCCQEGSLAPGSPSRRPHPSDASAHKSCCRKADGREAPASPAKGAGLRGGDCRKTLTASTFLAAAPSQASDAGKASFGELFTLIPPAAPLSLKPESLPACRDSWWGAHAPPPTDLVLSLQRLVI
jgi:hypothetical protein